MDGSTLYYSATTSMLWQYEYTAELVMLAHRLIFTNDAEDLYEYTTFGCSQI